jgi:putative PIN family toxin of toxin-antitoxin system
MQTPPRVILDTNVFVSGLINPHRQPAQVLSAYENGALTLLLVPALVSELGRVLRRPAIQCRHGLSESQLSGFLLRIISSADVVSPLADLPITVRDPKDEMFLAAALGGHADYILTGDADLLSLNGASELGTLQIVTVSAFLDTLSDIQVANDTDNAKAEST